jgi:hypothetical protein
LRIEALSGHLRKTEGAFCPICRKKFAVDRVVLLLLDDSVDKLFLTEFLKRKLLQDLEAKTVRDALTLTESQLQSAPWIGPVRARLIKNAAEEYISG